MKKRIFSFVLAVLMIASLLPATALAANIVDSGTCGANGSNLTWTLDSKGVLTISGRGGMRDYGASDAPWYDSRSRVKSAVIAEGVTSIGDSAFCNCTSLTSVTIPNSVTSIGDGAFASCTSLTGIRVTEGNSHYSSDASGVLFNKDKTTLVQCPGAFAAYTIPDSVTSIGGSAFRGCSSLTSVTIPDSVTSFGSDAFQGCTSLTSVTIPNSVTSIDYSAFFGCSSLTSVTIPNGVTSIGEQAFSGCKSLTSVTIPDSVTSIGKFAFRGCASLTSVTIPNSVTSIGDGAFASCTSLTGIRVTEGNSHYSSDASGVLFNKDKTTLVQCPGAFSGSYAIPDSVTSIGKFAFEGCTSLTSVTIPNSVTSIGSDAFQGCTSLTSVTIPDSVTSIGGWAFYYCTSLTSVTIPDGVTSIGGWAFYNCTSLTSVTIPDSVTSIGMSAFEDCTSLTDVYYAGSEAQWKAIQISYGNDALLNANIHYNYVFHTHSYKDVVTAPTCTEKGYTTHTCACGNSYVDTYVDALGHAWDNGKVTKEPTETETGVKTFTCTRCGETKTETMPVIPHVHSYKDVVTAPTCTAKGYTTHTCACGDSYVDTYTDPLGHDLKDDAAVAATCTTAGTTAGKHCTRCDYKEGMETIAALGHDLKDDAAVAATCTTAGTTAGKHCTRCDYKEGMETIAALGHAWDEGKVTKQPTETETGVKTFTCTRCGETRTETMPVIPHVHSYKDVVTAPTCTEKGYTTHTCACGDSYVDTYTDALGHAWDEGEVTKEATETTQGSMTYTCTRCPATKRDILPASGLVATAVYNDVKNDTSWFYPGVQYCLSYGLMSGMGNGSFAPGEYTTRAQVAQILYNLHGNPEVSGGTPFTDVPEGAWYQKAVTWAHSVGIVNGVTATTFSPNANITRQDFVLMLMRYLNNVRMVDRTWTPDDLSRFVDAGSVGFWALDAMKDAVAINAISGVTVDGRLCIQPARNATRAEAAKILMVFHETMTK